MSGRLHGRLRGYVYGTTNEMSSFEALRKEDETILDGKDQGIRSLRDGRPVWRG